MFFRVATQLGLLCGGAFFLIISAPGYPARNQHPRRLEGMSYIEARSIILHLGWTPINGTCVLVSANECSAFPEIQSCSGVGQGECALAFAKASKCLYVVTYGGEPSPSSRDTIVTSVSFRRTPCFRG